LRFVSRSYPSLTNRCEKLSCSRRMPWRAKIF
jgi:hypothetical protein